MNTQCLGLLERLLARVVGDPSVAEAIAGDILEEKPRFPVLGLLALVVRLAIRRPLGRPALSEVEVSSISERGTKPMSTVLQDVRYALRVLVRQPGFAGIVVVTLGVGLGANAVVLAMVDGMLLRPLPVANIDNVVQIVQANSSDFDNRDNVSTPDYLDYSRDATSFERLVAIRWWDVTLTDAGIDPERSIGRRVTQGFFEALNVGPVHGRGFAPDEFTAGRDRVVVISYRLWQRRWAGATSLVGSTITIDNRPYTVIGIAPRGFEYPTAADLWTPLVFEPEVVTLRGRRSLEVIGRLRSGVTIEAADSEMRTIAGRLEQQYPDTNRGYRVRLMPLSRAMLDIGLPAILAICELTVVLVLLIAGANVANLLLVRGTTRQRELALRLAVGASRWRVVRQLLVESVLLASLGALVAVPLAAAGLRVSKSFIPPEIARFIIGWGEVDIDGRLLGAMMLLAIVAGAIFGVVPALRASRPDLVESLKEGARGSTGGRRLMLRSFVVVQVALALTLLVAAGLSTRGAVRLLTQDDGYDPAGVMTFSMALPEERYPSNVTRLQFYDELLQKVGSLPGVEVAALANVVPFSGGGLSRQVEVEGGRVTTASERPRMDARMITPEYFRTMRVSVVRGRGIEKMDRDEGPRVAVINELMASQLWPGADAIGRRFRPTHVPDQPWLTVIGVASNVKHDWFLGHRPTYYVPFVQSPLDYATLVVRVRGDETTIAPAVRAAARTIDAHLPLLDVYSMQRLRHLRTVGMQFVAKLIAAFAAIGLFLSAIGIYGVMAYSVSQRTREIGVRMALGATGNQVMGMTLRDALGLTLAGVGIGLSTAYGLARIMAANLFGLVQLDVVTFVAFAALLTVVALVAGAVPARRATRVDPMAALRAE